MVLSPPQTVLKGHGIVTEKWESKLYSISAVDHSPFRSAPGERKGEGEGRPQAPLPQAARGELGRGHPPPSSPAAWERKGAGGKVRAALTPAPLPRCGGGVSWGEAGGW
jgi:hypothetical protein